MCEKKVWNCQICERQGKIVRLRVAENVVHNHFVCHMIDKGAKDGYRVTPEFEIPNIGKEEWRSIDAIWEKEGRMEAIEVTVTDPTDINTEVKSKQQASVEEKIKKIARLKPYGIIIFCPIRIVNDCHYTFPNEYRKRGVKDWETVYRERFPAWAKKYNVRIELWTEESFPSSLFKANP